MHLHQVDCMPRCDSRNELIVLHLIADIFSCLECIVQTEIHLFYDAVLKFETSDSTKIMQVVIHSNKLFKLP